MKPGRIEPISSGQFFLMVAVSVVAGGVYIWPSAVLADAGQGAPWTVMLSVGLALGLVWLQTLWPPQVPGATSLTRMHAVWGGARWPLFMVTLSIYLGLDGSLLALFSQMLHVNFYARTPLWFFECSIALVIGWMAAKSVSQVARNVQFWFPIIIASFFLLAGMALPHWHQSAAIRPSSLIALRPTFKGVVSTWYLWVQGEVIITLGAHVRSASWARIRLWALGAIAFQGWMLIVIYALVVGTLGPYAPIDLQWPLPFIFSDLTISALFISRPGLFILIAWVVALILYEAVTLMVLTTNLEDALDLGERARTGMVWALILLLLAIAIALSSPLKATRVVLDWIDPVALGLTLFTSILSPIIWFTWRRRHSATMPRR